MKFKHCVQLYTTTHSRSHNLQRLILGNTIWESHKAFWYLRRNRMSVLFCLSTIKMSMVRSNKLSHQYPRVAYLFSLLMNYWTPAVCFLAQICSICLQGRAGKSCQGSERMLHKGNNYLSWCTSLTNNIHYANIRHRDPSSAHGQNVKKTHFLFHVSHPCPWSKKTNTYFSRHSCTGMINICKTNSLEEGFSRLWECFQN